MQTYGYHHRGRPALAFKDLLRELRHARGYTQETLASEAGVSLASILAWERGVSPSVANLKKLASVLDVEWEDVMSADFPTDQRSGVRA
jgi:transcriptional regulator with XRE-family HTH domain